MKRKYNPVFILGVATIIVVAGFIALSEMSGNSAQESINSPLANNNKQASTRDSNSSTKQNFDFVGREQCSACHTKQYQAWQGSHHDLAMQEANEENVLGDFNNRIFNYFGVKSTFYKKDGKFFVKTDNANGGLQDFVIKYTFGVTPLQQYLIEFPGGRLQALNIVWDTRPEEQGGQRWFHLYPKENIDHKDPLHWTGVFQNWNNMCAECHSTNLKKNYDFAQDTYNTVWNEIDVSCEACHGPASSHVAWAKAKEKGQPWGDDGNKGLIINLADPGRGQWELGEGQPHAVRTSAFDTTVMLDTCARCHSRRSVLGDDYRHGRPLLDTHLPALLTNELYYADGQIKEEVYVYASFLQSKMHKAGVICSDCHDSHSLQLKAEGNALCTRCHSSSVFNSTSHHHHKENSQGAQCVNCHMPQTTYMVVDPRADHSFRIPRPDLSDELDSPNACVNCHAKKSNAWAAQAIEKWFASSTGRAKKHYGQVINAARKRLPQVDYDLAKLALDQSVPAVVRASSISLLSNYAYSGINDLLDRLYKDPDPLVRYAISDYLAVVNPAKRVNYLNALLNDPARAVRINTARIVLDTPARLLNQELQQTIQSVLDEYVTVLKFSLDRPEGRTNLASFYSMLGNADTAEKYFKSAIVLGPALTQAYVNLADLYRSQQRDEEAEQILQLGLQQAQNKAPIHHALGLNLVRQGKLSLALKELKQAVELAPNESRYAYVYGVALQSSEGYPAAIKYLEMASEHHPADLGILFTLASFNYENNDFVSAQRYADRLLVLAPQHQGAQQLLLVIKNQREK